MVKVRITINHSLFWVNLFGVSHYLKLYLGSRYLRFFATKNAGRSVTNVGPSLSGGPAAHAVRRSSWAAFPRWPCLSRGSDPANINHSVILWSYKHDLDLKLFCSFSLLLSVSEVSIFVIFLAQEFHVLPQGVRRSVVYEGALCIAGIHHHFTDCAHPGPPSPFPPAVSPTAGNAKITQRETSLFLLV